MLGSGFCAQISRSDQNMSFGNKGICSAKHTLVLNIQWYGTLMVRNDTWWENFERQSMEWTQWIDGSITCFALILVWPARTQTAHRHPEMKVAMIQVQTRLSLLVLAGVNCMNPESLFLPSLDISGGPARYCLMALNILCLFSANVLIHKNVCKHAYFFQILWQLLIFSISDMWLFHIWAADTSVWGLCS